MGGNTESSFDIETPSESLEESMTRELHNFSCSFSSTICRVPNEQRIVNEEAYTPRVVSLGPLHHGREGLRVREEHKMWYLKDFIKRSNVNIGSYIGVVKHKEERLRGCYAEAIPFSSEKFVKIILMDAVFIIQFLLRSTSVFEIEKGPVFSQWILEELVLWDMMMLENQLPFFILEDIFHLAKEMSKAYRGKWSYIFELSRKVVGAVVKMEVSEDKLATIYSSGVSHFVDMERLFYIPLSKPQTGRLETITTPSATELHKVGVRFKLGLGRSIFDIQFAKGILEMPRFVTNNTAEIRWRNLIAFEQCYCDEVYICDYVFIMDRLVNTQEDVDLLIKYGIVANRLGDSCEAARFINRLTRGVHVRKSGFYFVGLCKDLNTYSKISWRKWMSDLKQNYLHTPLVIISFIAGVILLMLTLIQTVCPLISLESSNMDANRH